MLAARSETPRPRPPAKARRSASTNRVLRPSASSPPPSYADSFGGGESLSHSTTEEILSSKAVRIRKEDAMDSDGPWGLRGDDDGQRYSIDAEDGGTHAWGRSPPESVSEMLDKTPHDVFREHEHDETGGVPVACRNLYGESVALRIPQAGSPQEATSPLPTMPPLFSTPSRGYYTYSHSTPERLSDLSQPHLRHRHSMSAADVGYLADQNAELLEKIEKLEQESSQADHSGRRQLKRLEKEIAELREELEKTQARSEELEEKAKRGWNSEQVINAVARKKLEREAKMKALRNLGQGAGAPEEAEVRNFAPEGSRFGGPSPGYSFMTPSRRSNSSVVFPISDDGGRHVSSPYPSNLAPQQELPVNMGSPWSDDRREIFLINKLMDKMTELQETNAQIIEQQVETTRQLQAFQKETEQMNRLYGSLGVPFELEDISDSEDDQTGLTRYHSFSHLTENRSLRSASAKKHGRTRWATLASNDAKAEKKIAERASASTTKLNLPVPFPPSPNMNRHHSCSSLHEAFASPALSLLSLDTAAGDLKQPTPLLPTLQSELGNALNTEDGDGNDFHIRSTSIFDLSGKPSNISVPPSPSPSPGHLQAHHPAAEGGENAEDTHAPPTPMSLGPRGNSLLLYPEITINELPATPVMDNRPRLEITSPGLQSPRYYRMSQTVRSRTDRWVRGRFSGSLVGSVDDVPVPPPQPPSSIAPLGVSQRLAQAFESVVEGYTPPGMEAVTADEAVDSPPSSGRSSVTSVYEDAALAADSPPQDMPKSLAAGEQQGLGKVVLQLWLWLQFIVIILVFLWAMARRGPKAVLLEGSDSKRASSGRR